MRYLYGGKEVWGIPGGGINDGETLIDTLKRELDEELGVAINVGELLCVVETPAAGRVKHTLHCVFLGKITGGVPRVNVKHTSSLAAEWVKADALDDLVLYPPVNDTIKESLAYPKKFAKSHYLGIRTRQWL